MELLGLNELENNEEIDLMTLIVNKKNYNHAKIIKAEKEKENINKKNQKKIEEENTINTNKIIESTVKTVETIKYNIITAKYSQKQKTNF